MNLGLTNHFLKAGVVLVLAAIVVGAWTVFATGPIDGFRAWLAGFLFWSGAVLYIIGRFAGRSRDDRPSRA